MGGIPDIKQAADLLAKYNKESFHIKHGETVSAVMGWYADKHEPENKDYWRVVGLLHDIDFELYPEQHCVKGADILRGENIDESIIKSAMSHGFGMTGTQHEPELYMEKVLFAVDELTGLIGAVALMRPSKSVSDLETPSVTKKFKDKKFAAGCSRDTIRQGADKLGVTLEELISETILGMRAYESGEY